MKKELIMILTAAVIVLLYATASADEGLWRPDYDLFKRTVELGTNIDVRRALDARPFLARAVSNNGTTMLHVAVRRGNKEIVEYFIKKGADVKAKNKDGWTPLHQAAFGGSRDMVELLITSGADVNVLDRSGRSPLKVAIDQGNTEIVELLRSKDAGEKEIP